MALRLYTFPNSYRGQKTLIAAEYNQIKIEQPKFEIGKDNKTAEFKKKNPMQKVPVLELPGGRCIFESNAIARYVARLRPDTGLLGSTVMQQSLVDQWIDFCATELEAPRAVWLYQVLGWFQSNPKAMDEAKKDLEKALNVLEDHLLARTFLVGNQVTLADIVVFVALVEPMQKLFAPKFLSKFTNLVRWFNTVHAQKQVQAVVGAKIEFAKEEAKVGGAKEDKKDAAKEEKKAAHADDLAAAIPAEKPKSILDSLPESPMGHIDVTKKLMFSVRPILPDFFEKHFPQFDPQGYSWWLQKYNYDNDNQVFFMTGNAIGGFLQRSDASRKYALGVMNIIGKDEDTAPFCLRGAWMFRGTDVPKEMMQENPDAEYYTWTKVDVSTEEGQKLIKEQFMGDTIEGMQVLDRRYFK